MKVYEASPQKGLASFSLYIVVDNNQQPEGSVLDLILYALSAL